MSSFRLVRFRRISSCSSSSLHSACTTNMSNTCHVKYFTIPYQRLLRWFEQSSGVFEWLTATARSARCERIDAMREMIQIRGTELYVYAFAPLAFASSAAATAGFTFFPSFHRTRGGGARLRRPSRERTRTTKNPI